MCCGVRTRSSVVKVACLTQSIYISFVPGCIFSVTDVWEVMEAERGPSAVVLGGDYTVDHVVALVDAVII